MDILTFDEQVLAQYQELNEDPFELSDRKKFVLARQLDFICESLTETNYLAFDTLATVVMETTYHYYTGRPAHADEGDAFTEIAYAKNLYQIARKLKALQIQFPVKEGAELGENSLLSIFDHLKYSYLLHRIYELRDMLAVFMGRWGYSDLWSCFDRFIRHIESLHLQVTGKKLNSTKRFQYWLAQMKTFPHIEGAFRDKFLSVFAQDYRDLWYEEIMRG